MHKVRESNQERPTGGEKKHKNRGWKGTGYNLENRGSEKKRQISKESRKGGRGEDPGKILRKLDHRGKMGGGLG